MTTPTYTRFWGIDYGSKLAGTTVIAQYDGGLVTLLHSQKKQDADAMILAHAQATPPDFIFLDAPLSLPGVYRALPDTTDYFYRAVDKAVKGMSPMFLGGLTARAMQLRTQLAPIPVHETYPALHARAWALQQWHYKKQITYLPSVLDQVLPRLPFRIAPSIVTSWHALDAVLALYSAYRYAHQQHEAIGHPEEGQLYW